LHGVTMYLWPNCKCPNTEF